MNTKVFVKFGIHETTFNKRNELLFFGVDIHGASVCLRVRDLPATCRFALPPSATKEECDAFGAWLASGAFVMWIIGRLGDKMSRVDPNDVVLGIERETLLPADRPSREPWAAWRVSFCCVAVAAFFAYEDPFESCATLPRGPRPHVFSCARKGSVVLQEFYRTRDVAPFTWWEAKGVVPVRQAHVRKARDGIAEFFCTDVEPARDAPPQPGTSVLVFDIEAVKNYPEPGETGVFDVGDERERLRQRRALDAQDPKNKGILNSWHDHKVCNVHLLLWRDWDAKSREPDRSVCLVLSDWDGAPYPAFERGEVGDIHRPDLFQKETEIKYFRREGDLIAAFYGLINEFDCDVITGWNINGYDLWMLERRAEVTGVLASVCRFSRLQRQECRCKELNFQTGGKGSFGGKKELVIPGRVVLDGMFALQKDFSARVSLSSFSLNSAADYYVKDALGKFATKDDLPYEEMRRAFANASRRTFFVKYCLKDTYLTALVLQRMDIVSLYKAFATFVGIELHAVTFQGETERTLPNLRRLYERQTPVIAMEERSTRPAAAKAHVEGGLVHKPVPGVYDEQCPLGCLDFASLYPSVMIGHNLCPTTAATRGQLLKLGYKETEFQCFPAFEYDFKRQEEEDDEPKAKKSKTTNESQTGNVTQTKVFKVAEVTDDTYAILLPSVRMGMCPQAAANGLELRGTYKKKKKAALAAGNEREAAKEESLELAVKASNNSLYGITIQVHCAIFNPQMANAITLISRNLNLRMTYEIESAPFRDRVLQHLDDDMKEVAKGFIAEIVYGDTLIILNHEGHGSYRKDSVFAALRFTQEALLKYGNDMRRFAAPIFQVMEKLLNRDLFRVPLVMRSFRDEGKDEDGPLRIEYEKLCSPAYLDKAKKTYFYVECELDTGKPVKKSDGTWSVKVTGGQGKKRNNPPIVAKMEKAYIQAIVGNEDLSAKAISERIKNVTRTWVRDVADDAVPWSDYVASTKLTKDAEEYDTANVATSLLERLGQRDPSRVVAVGDRISYLVVDGDDAKKKKRDMCEEVGDVVRGDMAVNLDYVLNNVVRNTMFKFLAIAGVEDRAEFVEDCKRLDLGESGLLKPKKRSVKQMQGAPAMFGGLKLIKRPSCRVCKQPALASGVCESCAASTKGRLVLEDRRARDARVVAYAEEYARKCGECRREALGATTDIEDVGKAVESCANSACETWLARHWAKRKMRA